MGKSNKGGVFGFIRGRVGSVSYSVISAKNSKSGKKEQIIRALPENVANPQTAAQVMQRMKITPAQRFYSAFANLLNNAFEGVAYGDASRRYFMSLAMKKNGPYMQRGVDRFIPAIYPFSEGSIPSVPVEGFAGGASLITLGVTTTEAQVTPAILAGLLNVTTDYQLSVVVVDNVNGLFVPKYAGFEDRLLISDIPAAALAKDSANKVTISPAALGIETTSMVACCVVLSTQDATGKWLRSTQDMVISNELYTSLYSTDALSAAIASYTNGETVNAINSDWYYNLGMSQAFSGTLRMMYLKNGEYESMYAVVGIRTINGVTKYTVFTDNVTSGQGIMEVTDTDMGTIELTPTDYGMTVAWAESKGYSVELWKEEYASQLGFGVRAAGNAGGLFTVKGYIGEDASDITIVNVIYPGARPNMPILLTDSDGRDWAIISDDTASRTYQKALMDKNGYEYGGSDGEYKNAWTNKPEDINRIVPICPSGTYQLDGAKANWETISAQLGVGYNVWVHVE